MQPTMVAAKKPEDMEFTDVDKALLEVTAARAVTGAAMGVRVKLTFPDTFTLQDAFHAGLTAVQAEVMLETNRFEDRYRQIAAKHKPGKKRIEPLRVGLILFFLGSTLAATQNGQPELVGVFAIIAGALIGRELGIRKRL